MVAFVMTEVQNNLNSLQCDTVTVTVISCGIFTEWNIIQQLTQRRTTVFAGYASEAISVKNPQKQNQIKV